MGLSEQARGDGATGYSRRLLIALIACAPDAERELRVLSSASGDPAAPASDTADTGAPTEDAEASFPELGCGLGKAWSEVPSAVSLDWCVRLSPEAGSITDYALPDTAEPLDTGSPAEPDPGNSGGETAAPPCGFTNLVGNLGLVGTTVLYCDADRDGGGRLARLGDAGTANSDIVASEDCVPDPAAGQLVAEGAGFLAAWAGTSGAGDSESANPGLSLARLDVSGHIVDGPSWSPLPATAHRVAIAGGSSRLAAGLDYDQTLTLLAYDDALAVAASVPVGSAIGNFSVLADGEGGAWLASCPADDSAMVIARVSASLEVVASTRVTDSSCGWYARPSLALHDGTLLAGWIGGAGAGVVALDAALTEQWRLPMGGDAGPQAARGPDGWVILGGDGALSTVSDGGEVLATAWHPGIVDADGSVVDLRLSIDGDTALVILYGLSTYPLVTGHVNTFNYVEASRARLP